MKKALQIGDLRAKGSVSDRAVVRGPSERGFYDFRNRFTQFWIDNPGGHRLRLPFLLRRRLRGRRLHLRGRLVGEGAGHETEARRARQASRDLGRTLGQLEAPDGVAHVDNERSVGLRAGRPGVARDLLAYGRSPRVGRLGTWTALAAEPAELLANIVPDRIHQAASATAPGETSSSWSGSAGRRDGSVAVTSAWPERRTRSARIRRRLGSSSERTSSSRSARSASRCSPWEPKLRRSWPPATITTSSRCGPREVVPRSRSRASAESRAARVGGSPS